MGRLALRHEGDDWRAYYALPDSMEGALLLGSVRMAVIADDPRRRDAFIDLMKEGVGDIIEQATGARPEWPGDRSLHARKPPPETEPAGLIGREWASFNRELLTGAPADQVREMRRAFYGGARCCLTAFLRALSPGEDVTAADEAILQGISDELDVFMEDVCADKA